MRTTIDQARELARCRYDVGYFVSNYCWLRHTACSFPIRFTPWTWQESLLYLWQAGRNTINNKSRQIGWSWTALAYTLWLLCFRRGAEIYLISYNEVKSKSLMRKLKFMFERLPDWLRPVVPSRGGDNKMHLAVRMRYHDEVRGAYEWADGFVSSLTTTGASGAGESATLVVADEVALWKERQDDEATWAALAPTTTHGGQLIITSTPRGCGGVFHRIWVESVSPMMNDALVDDFTPYDKWNRAAIEYYRDRDAFIPLKAHYSMCYHDDAWIEKCSRGMSDDKAHRIHEYFSLLKYDDDWRNRQAERMRLPAVMIMQEYGLTFDRPGNAIFDSASLNRCYKPPGRHPDIRLAIERSKRFFGGVDTAEGISKRTIYPDYNSAVVLNERAIQVYALHNRNSISEWAGTTERNPITDRVVEVKGDVLRVIEDFPGEWVIEKNGPGSTVINRVEPHVPVLTNVISMAMTGPTKSKLVNDLAYAIENGHVVITDYFTLECMRQYINLGNSRYGAAPGFFDDPVVAFMWAYWRYQYSTQRDLNLTLDLASDKTRRVIAINQEDDLTPEEAGVTRRGSGGLGPMPVPQQQEYVNGIAVLPSPILDRSFGGRGRQGDFHPRRRYYDDMHESRVRRPRRE